MINKLFSNLFISILLVYSTSICQGQINNIADLRNNFQTIINESKATIGIAVIHLERGDSISLNNEVHYPMQSVYKFPLALAVLNQIDSGNLNLNQTIKVAKLDLLPNTWSPLKKKYPNGNIELTVAELLNYTVSQSDNIACDLLFKIMNGPSKVNEYIHRIGFKEIQIVSTENELHSDINVQFKNWCKPITMSHLLKDFYEKKILSDSSSNYLLHLMTESSNTINRIKGLLPADMIVAHKTGTSGENEKGVRAGCNDVGVITLPDGKHLAISIFVSNSPEKIEKDEEIIAKIAKVAVEYFIKN